MKVQIVAGSLGAVSKCGNVRVKKRLLTALLVAVALMIVAAFAAFIALSAVAGRGFGSRMQYIFIPFAVFGACAITIPLILVTRTRYAQLCAIADMIAAKDATVIASLAPQQTVQAFEAMKITVGAIVAGGAVPDYEIVGEVVAKRSLSLTEEDAKKMYIEFLTLALPEAAALGMAKERADATPRHCPSCGAPVTSEGAKFCESCGVKLKGGD